MMKATVELLSEEKKALNEMTFTNMSYSSFCSQFNLLFPKEREIKEELIHFPSETKEKQLLVSVLISSEFETGSSNDPMSKKTENELDCVDSSTTQEQLFGGIYSVNHMTESCYDGSSDSVPGDIQSDNFVEENDWEGMHDSYLKTIHSHNEYKPDYTRRVEDIRKGRTT